MAPSRYDWKIVDWDVKPQHNQHNLLARIYFNSNTQEMMKKQLYSSDSSNFPQLHWRIQQIFWL